MSSQEENITKFSRNINADDESKTGLSDDGIIRKRPEQFEEADRDNIKQTTLNYVVQNKLRLIMSFRNLKKPELKSVQT